MADLKQSGTMQVVREVFMILVMTGTRTSWYYLVRGIEIGSRLQLFEAVFKISFSMLALVTGSKTVLLLNNYVISTLFNFVVEKLTKCIRQITGGDVIG